MERLRKMMGKSVPPADDPRELMPSAVERRFLNQCPRTPITGPMTIPEESWITETDDLTKVCRMRWRRLTPMPNPWQRRNCQYALHSGTSRVHPTTRKDATIKDSLKHPRSNMRPAMRPGRKVIANCAEPIHALDSLVRNVLTKMIVLTDILEGDTSLRMCSS